MMSHDVNFIFMESTGDMNLDMNPLYPIQKLYPLLYPIKYEPIISIIISHYLSQFYIIQACPRKSWAPSCANAPALQGAGVQPSPVPGHSWCRCCACCATAAVMERLLWKTHMETGFNYV